MRWEHCHLEADKSNTGESLARPGLSVKVERVIPPPAPEQSWSLGRRGGGRVMSALAEGVRWCTLQSVSHMCWWQASLRGKRQLKSFLFLQGTS